MSAFLRARIGRVAIAGGLVAGTILPSAGSAGSAGSARAADPVVLRVGTTQDLDSTNPWQTSVAVGYEVFQLTYSLLTDFDKDAKPAPGFAESWTRDADKVTFKIRPGMSWSDGQPADSADVCFTWGLAMAAIKDDTNVGAGYLDPNIKDAGVTKIECPDATSFVAYTTDESDRIYQVYVPILPKHIFGQDDYKKIADETFNAPLVGTGPYTLAEWKTGQFARFVRNPNFWGQKGFADEVEVHFYKTSDTMVQALKSNELDYAHRVNPDQFNQLKADPTYGTTVGKANGWTQLAFNTYGTGTGKTIKGGGPSTTALRDTAFRDALGYAVDKKTLVDRVLGGYGDVGTTNVPPILKDWHVEPDKARTFDVEMAKSKLDAAGYKLDANGKRLDKQNKPIKLRLDMPDSDENYPKAAQFIKEWYGQLGIDVTTAVMTSSALATLILPPPDEQANYDIELWGWSGSPDPLALLQIFRCDAIGGTSDSQYCNPEFDKLYEQQLTEAGDARKTTLARIQNLIYDEAPYDILYYNSSLDVWRTDRFAGWQNMPADGTPLFTYGILDYTLLTDAEAQPTTGPGAAPGAATGAPSAAASGASSTNGGNDSSSGTNTILIVVVAGLVILAIAAVLLTNRRRTTRIEDE
jgi:peptide/nickel transport system substrate-binding protein